ncbi:hypothetical protein COB52_02085 [Candidatus Kaiserbacteria bacterium]|nr:MAG: hypothetical protein COB52_02085 [Candidatus Kaiserbacteria bacterium]
MVDETKSRILIIEDEDAYGDLLEIKLVREGYAISRARNGKEGLTMALQEHPRIILLDLKMPKADGVEVLKLLRGDSWGKDVEVMILTNIEDSNQAREAVEYGVDNYFIKSDLEIKKIVEKIKDLCPVNNI